MKLALLMVLAVMAITTNSSANSGPPSGKASSSEPPDIIFLNGDIYTQATPARAQAMAVRDGRIVAVGTNDDIRKLKGAHTQVVDLGGHFVMPGFNDAHVHLACGRPSPFRGRSDGQSSRCRRCSSGSRRTQRPCEPGEWVVGGGWDHTLWTGQQLPTRQDLDSVTGNHPAFLSRVDGHISVGNTAALKAAGITAQTPDPPGGKIDHDAKGEPTGIIREEPAEILVWSKIPPPTLSQRRRAAEYAIANAAQWGVTSAQDYSTWEAFLTYEDLEREGKLTLRISEWLDFDDSVDLLEKHRVLHSAR